MSAAGESAAEEARDGAGDAAAPRPRPAGNGEIFAVFTRLALQGFGGVLPVAQRELVERARWLTKEQFLESLAVAQVLPGPNIINLALMIGDRFAGWRGALAAMGGLLAAPLVVVLLLAVLAAEWRHLPAVAGALHGMAVVAAALVAATAFKLVGGLKNNPLGPGWAALYGLLTLVGVGVLRWPLPAVVLGLGPLAIATAWWRLGRSVTGDGTAPR